MTTRPTRRDFIRQSTAGMLLSSSAWSTLSGEEGFHIPIGVCTSLSNVGIAHRAGCDYIEEGVRRLLVPDRPEDAFRRNLDALREAEEQFDMPVMACNSFLPGELKSTGPEADHDGVLLFAETAFRRAGEAGVGIIVFGSGGSRRIPDGFDRGEARDQFLALLARMGPLAESAGVTVAIEPLQRSECNFINTVTEGRGIVQDVNHPAIRLLADIFHMMREEEGPDVLAAGGSGMPVHLHIAEKAERTPPGTAGDDFTPFFKTLLDTGYRGLLSIECRWDDMAVQLPRAVQTLRDQSGRAGDQS